MDSGTSADEGTGTATSPGANLLQQTAELGSPSYPTLSAGLTDKVIFPKAKKVSSINHGYQVWMRTCLFISFSAPQHSIKYLYI